MDQTTSYPVPAVVSTGRRLEPIQPNTMAEVKEFAKIVVASGLAPRDFNTPEKVFVAIIRGREIGLTAMMSLEKIAVINGRTTLWGDAVPGIALSTSLLEDWTERVDGSGDQMVASCTVKRKGVRSPMTKTFSVSDAKVARLWGKAGPWQQYPQRMLQMRARVAFRDMFADALGGLYIAEELMGVDEPKDIPPPTPVMRELPVLAGKKSMVEAHLTSVNGLPPEKAAAPPEQATQPAALEGEIVAPPPAKAATGRKLPPLSRAKSQPVADVPEQAPVQEVEELAIMDAAAAAETVDKMRDELEEITTMAELTAWATVNVPIKNRMPRNYRSEVEQHFNLKQATLRQTKGKGE